MKRKIILPIILIGVLAAVGVFAAVKVVTPVSAAAPAAAYRAITGDAPFGDGRGDTYLAEALGITTDELSAAYQKAHEAAIDQALAAGTITQEQADALKNRTGEFGRHGGRGPMLGSDGDFDALLANALGISTDELNAAYGKAFEAKIAAAVAAGDMTEDEANLMRGRYALYNDGSFQSAMKSAFENAVNQAVQSGVITQAQADQILASDQPGFGFGGHGMRGFDRFGGPGGRRGGHDFRGEPGFLPPADGTAPDGSTTPAPTGTNG